MTRARRLGLLLAGCCLPGIAAPLRANEPPRAVAAPLPPALPMPQDRHFPGTLTVSVTPDPAHHVFEVAETIPVAPGPLTLLYPKWIPGTHAPEGAIAALAGLRITADGRDIEWQRDTVDVYAFHLTVPAGVTRLALSFQYLSPPTAREGDVVLTGRIAILHWWQTVLYPAGYDGRDIQVAAALTLPAQWQFGTALPVGRRDGATSYFAPAPLDMLVDSPVYAGRYFARYDLAPQARVPVHLDVVADAPQDLAIKDPDLVAHRALVTQAARNFASQHYDHFDFLLSLSDEIGWRGLEHHRSSENGQDPDYFTDPAKSALWRDLLPHEYTHSWDGKFRRPSDLFSPDFNAIPERGSLLWVYEGQTEYWGRVLTARAGLESPPQFRDFLALEAASLQASAGRGWRNVQDTTDDPVINERRPLAWPSWSRAEDYYMEGMLIWLDADTLIRQKTGNRKSLTDFAQAFFGAYDGSFAEYTYGFGDVVAALNAVMPCDWAGFLRQRLDSHPNTALLDGITRAGWRLMFTDSESELEKNAESVSKSHGFGWSLGLSLGQGGLVSSVRWDGPAFRAGLSRGVTIVAVNGVALDGAETLAAAITQARRTQAPITLLVRDGRQYRSVAIDYHGGLRYPHLEPIPGAPDLLGDILRPL